MAVPIRPGTDKNPAKRRENREAKARKPGEPACILITEITAEDHLSEITEEAAGSPGLAKSKRRGGGGRDPVARARGPAGETLEAETWTCYAGQEAGIFLVYEIRPEAGCPARALLRDPGAREARPRPSAVGSNHPLGGM